MPSLTKAAYVAAAVIGVVVVAWLAFRQSQLGLEPLPGAGRAAGSSGALGVDPAALKESHPDLLAGLAALADNRLDEALARFQEVPETSPAYLAARSHVGGIQSRQGDLESAERTFDEVTRARPDAADAWQRLAVVRFAQGRFESAEQALLRILELAPDDIATRYEIGLVRLAQGQTNDAIGAYVRAMKTPAAPDQQRLYVMQAVERLERFQLQHADWPDVHYALAFFANSLGRRQIEVEELELFLAAVGEGALADRAREQLRAARDPAPAAPRP